MHSKRTVFDTGVIFLKSAYQWRQLMAICLPFIQIYRITDNTWAKFAINVHLDKMRLTFKRHKLTHYFCEDEMYCKDENFSKTGAKPQQVGSAHLKETFLYL